MSKLCNNVYVWFSHVAILLVNRKLKGVVGIIRHLRTAGDRSSLVSICETDVTSYDLRRESSAQ